MKVTTGPGSPAPPESPWDTKLIEAAQGRWRAVDAPHLVALVRNGAVCFTRVNILERPIDITPETATAEPADTGSGVA